MDENVLRVLMVEDNPGDARLLREFLGEVDDVRFELTQAERLSDALQYLGKQSFDAVLLDLRLPDSQGIDTFIQIYQTAPQVPIVVLTGLYDEKLAVEAVENGAQDYLVKGHVDGASLCRALRFAIARHATQAQATGQPRARARVVGFMGAKGGAGTTTVVANVAATAAEQAKDVIVVDLRPCYGTLALQFGQAAVQNLSDLLELEPQAIDERELAARIIQLNFGPRVLFGPQHPDEFAEVTPETAEAIIEGLAGMAEVVVIDLPSYPSAASEVAAQHCDFTVIVVEREPGSIASAKVMLDLLKSWGLKQEQIGAVFVNRTAYTAGVSMSELNSQFACSIVGVVQPAADLCLEAQMRGLPLVLVDPDNIAAASLVELANRVISDKVVPLSF
ncbi:MAG: AAA family ATPase [Armatimonadota bacterium]